MPFYYFLLNVSAVGEFDDLSMIPPVFSLAETRSTLENRASININEH